MSKDKFRYLLDLVPLIILTVYSIILVWTIATTNIVFTYEHYIGLTLLVASAVFFIKKQKLGVLSLGFTLLLGLFKVLSYSAVITYYVVGGSINGHSSSKIKIQGIFLLWLLIHFIVSRRHYVGIATNKYWQDLFSKPTKTTDA